MKQEVVAYPGCFVCGEDNKTGLQLKFYWDGKRCHTRFAPTEAHSGYRRLLHGGIISTVLDEVMIKALLAQGIVAVTGEMTIRFRAPADTHDTLDFYGSITKSGSRVIQTEGVVRNSEGEMIANATGSYVRIKSGEFKEQLLSSLPESYTIDN